MKIQRHAWLLIVALLLGGCGSTTSLEVDCERLAEIRILPFKGETVDDDAYNYFLSLGPDANACLVGSLLDTTITEDPRQAPIYSPVAIGDVAFWVLLRINKELEYEKALPPEVVAESEHQGVYAYFSWVAKDGNRAILANRVTEMLEN